MVSRMSTRTSTGWPRRPQAAASVPRPQRLGSGLSGRLRFLSRRVSSRSLFWRVFLVNAALLVAAAIALALSPATVSFPVKRDQVLVLAAGLIALLAANAALLHVSLSPLRELARLMRRIDLLTPGQRLGEQGASELRAVIATFNQMLARLELERRASSSHSASKQEDERRRVAVELHDEVGQGLTALLLHLKNVADDAPAALKPAVAEAQAIARDNLDEVRRIARNLRPTVLDDLGLAYGLHSLLDVVERTSSLTIERRIAIETPPLTEMVELALWRMAQEAVTNVIRHADATVLKVEFEPFEDGRGVRLAISDDGRGMVYAADVESGGIRAMRERALAADARLEIRSRPGGGTRVSVSAPAEAP
jgi:two-component system sensor histidine kinase UhpB